MKKIRSKILVPMLLLVTVSLVLVGGIASWLNYKSTFSTLEQTMSQTCTIAAQRISHQLKENVNIALETGSIARLANPDTKLSDKKAIIDQRADSYDFVGGGILDPSGLDIFTQKNYSNMEFFELSLQGEFHISEPLVWEETGEIAIILSAPLWQGGIPNTSVVGVTYFIAPSFFLNDIVTSIKISNNGSAYVIDEQGTTIAHIDAQRVTEHENIFEVAKSTPALTPLADIHTQMVAEKSGFATYSFGGTSKFVAYAPITNTHGWSIAINAPISEFMQETYFSIALVIVMLLVFILIAAVIAYLVSSGISKPVAQIAATAKQLSEGDMSAQITYTSANELGLLADCMRKLCGTVTGIIQNTENELGAMGAGDFTAQTSCDVQYVGDFATLRESLDSIRASLNRTLLQINVAADQVSTGADQMASGSQTLSQGAVQQASSVQELSATISEISDQIKYTADYAQKAMVQSGKTGDEVVVSNQRMQRMMAAMDDISAKSSDIGKIIKVIEDIAFQTNILALNAAVEAARAGASGKGFAVVADEVRNLAGKSAEAAKNTTSLIQETVLAVEQGTQIADDTAKALLEVVESTREITALITEISDASQEQAQSISQVGIGMGNISSVIQTNSATAEESAATSEELSGQAQMLQRLVSEFKLEQSGGSDAEILTRQASGKR